MSGRLAYDLENSNYILSFAAPLVEGWLSPVRQMRALANFHQGRPGHRGKFVQIESRLSATAAKADEWVPVRPGTEGMVALGIAHILIREDLYDRAFAENYLLGFEDGMDGRMRKGFKSVVLEQYRPQKVTEITGVPAETLERLATEFARYQPSLALGRADPQRQGEEDDSTSAVNSLNALVGSIDRPGGVLVQHDPPLSSWPPVNRDAIASNGLRRRPLVGTSSGHSLSDALLEEKPYKSNILFLLGANPLFSTTGFSRDALRRIPFVVSFSLFLGETAQEADLVLPDCSPFERWDLQTNIPGFAVTTVGIGQPTLAPIGESKPAGETILELAKALGGSTESSFPWKDSLEALKALVVGLYRSRRGTTFTSEFKDEHLQSAYREWQWAPQDYPSFEEFWRDVTAKGGWVDPYYRYGDYSRTLQTPSRKFRLPSLPSQETRISKGDEGYPFYLYLFQPLALANDVSANLPFLQEIAGSAVHSPWDSWVEINPRSAKELGIKNGDWVFIESPTGKVKTRARLFPGAMPDVVSVPTGQGHTALGRWAKNRGVNPLSLVDGRGPTKVRIYKAS
jgi:anaerobic selenocysteine-containing dehydrogenase